MTGVSLLQGNSSLKYDAGKMPPRRATKIICTIGPSTQSVESLKTLIGNGMNVVRMNFSHGTHAYHEKTVENAKQAAQELDANLSIALDTKGPEIRTGLFPEGEIKLSYGQELYVTTDKSWKDCGSSECFYIDYSHLPSLMKPGDRIYIDDGLLGLDVVSVEGDRLRVRVAIPSAISSNKGCNLPDKPVELPAVSQKDREDLLWARKFGVDMIFASFIRCADQVEEVRDIVGPGIMIISKIENQQGLDNIDEIIEKSDGVMIARGDLGVEIPPESLLLAQKMIIAKCNIAGKPVICATQMLDSMTNNPRPTRAEISDVGNAVLDGVDCVMLSGETAKGQFPNATVDVMSRICANTQKAMVYQRRTQEIIDAQGDAFYKEDAFARAVVRTAFENAVQGIVILCHSTVMVQNVSKYHPSCPIFAITYDEKVCRKLSIVRSAEPLLHCEMDFYADPSIERVRVILGKKAHFLKEGNPLLLVKDGTESTLGGLTLFNL
ncbi:pyruvate kinase [Perkinsela sp. CCAP 1560/4]|nr:pyruvate kinase [Perkinsela sp. CCAP 1560/4]|eukprot:KNH06085.1 pyruvate kinase [Perkinsela sp. CCAP 1560/4]